MDASPALHPTDQTLQSYGLGKLDDRSARAINRHLEGCAACRQRVGAVSSDTFLGRLLEARKPSSESTSGRSLVDGSLSFTKANAGESGSSPPPADTLPPGLANHPDYEIKKELGRGGMGVVYLAHNRMMGRDEVLKVMGRQVMERPGVLERFQREIKSVAKLRHPNIVTAYTAFRLDGDLVFAMEYVEGLDLAKLVKAKGGLPIIHAAYFIHQAALGLQHAHEKETVHRDIKPHNLMLTQDGKSRLVKVLDFGLAKATRVEKVDAALTSAGQALGTPDYIAPEQILNATDADIRADLYSLGGTLYYLLTGRPPFLANSLYDMYQAHVSRDADPLNLIRPEVPAELAALVSKMMAKDPGRRFQTPAEVAEALLPFFKKAAATNRSPIADVARPGPTSAARPDPAPASIPAPVATDAGRPGVRPEKPAVQPVAEARWEELIDLRDTDRSTVAVPVAEPGPPPNRKTRRMALGGSLFGLIALGVIILTIKHQGGEITIAAPDDKAFKVEKDGIVIENKPSNIGPNAGRTDGPPSDSRPGANPQIVATGTSSLSDRPMPPASYHGRWEVHGDELTQSDPQAKDPVILFGDDRWADYDFTADFMRLDSKAELSLIARCTDHDNSLQFHVSRDTTHIRSAEQGISYRYLRSIESGTANREWYTARVRVRGNHIEASLWDGSREVVHLEADDNKHPAGRVGFQTKGSSSKVRNIRVTSPDGKVLWEGLPKDGKAFGGAQPDIAGGAAQAWKALFNGKDLSGWTGFRGGREVAPEEIFTVDRGEQAYRPRARGAIATRVAYGDFVFSCDFAVGPYWQSGLWFSPEPIDPAKLGGFECMVVGDMEGEEFGSGDIYSAKGLMIGGKPHVGEVTFHRRTMRPRVSTVSTTWNTYEVQREGPRFTLRINGVEINRVESTWSGPWRIGLNAQGAESVRFRNIMIRELQGENRSSVPNPVAQSRHAASIPSDAKWIGGKAYKLYAQSLSWHDAEARCRQMGGQLAVVTNETENRALATMAKEQGLEGVWLGATDERVEGQWVWVDGSAMRYENWNRAARQPNNKLNSEHYLTLLTVDGHNGQWSDQPDVSTQHRLGVACQWDAGPGGGSPGRALKKRTPRK